MTTMLYVGVSACGCIRSATIDNPTRKDAEYFVLSGDTIERMKVEQVRVQFCWNKHPIDRATKKPVCPHPGVCPRRPVRKVPHA